MRRTMGNEWIDVQVHGACDAGELAGLLRDPWMTGGWQEDGVVHLYWPQDRWTPEAHEKVIAAVDALTVGSTITVHAVPNEDWNAAWAQSVKPLRIGRRILIRPSWEAAATQPGDAELILDPKQAFGTGHHATTQLVLEWLETSIHGGERILDVGTGSGILAMVALRLGAASAWGIDCDPIAVKCARGYATENHFGPELVFETTPVMDLAKEQFDIVLANLDRRTLLTLGETLLRLLAPHGRRRLVLSGLLTDDRNDMIDAFRKSAAVLAWERARDGWLALEFTCHDEAIR